MYSAICGEANRSVFVLTAEAHLMANQNQREQAGVAFAAQAAAFQQAWPKRLWRANPRPRVFADQQPFIQSEPLRFSDFFAGLIFEAVPRQPSAAAMLAFEIPTARAYRLISHFWTSCIVETTTGSSK